MYVSKNRRICYHGGYVPRLLKNIIKFLIKALRALSEYHPYPKSATQETADNPQRHLNNLWPCKLKPAICPSCRPTAFPSTHQAQLPTRAKNWVVKMQRGDIGKGKIGETLGRWASL